MDNIFIINTFEKNFEYIFNRITEKDMYEGLVLKKKNAKLEMGVKDNNNSNSMIKIRKETKNYRY